MNIAVFCASSDQIGEIYFEEAFRLGKGIAEEGWGLVYGGTNIGLMKTVADATMEHGGEVTGIIAECIAQQGITADRITHLIIAPDMKQRKHLLREHANAFIALPGGWGTLEEITEVMTLKQLGIHNKPVVFLNTAGFYNTFLEFIRNSRLEKFISAAYDRLYAVVDTPQEAINYIKTYKEENILSKYK